MRPLLVLLFITSSTWAAFFTVSPAKYRHKISFMHHHRYSNIISKQKPSTAEALKPTELKLGQTSDFGDYRFEYSILHLWYGLGLWAGFTTNAHQGSVTLNTVNNNNKSTGISRLAFGLLAGVNYTQPLSKRFYLLAAMGAGNVFDYTIDIDLPQSAVSQKNGRCNETCVTGSAPMIVYSLSVGFHITQYVGYEIGIEHQLFFTHQTQQLSDGNSTLVTASQTELVDSLAGAFSFTLRLGKI